MNNLFAKRIEQDKICPKCKEKALAQISLDTHFDMYECQKCGYQGSGYASVHQIDPRQTRAQDLRQAKPL